MWPRIAIIIGLVAAAYAVMLPAPFKTMDDRVSIVDNPAIKSAKNVPEIFQQGFFHDRSYYRPLVNLSFMGEYRAFKLDSFFYNLDNLLLHAFNAVLVFLIAARLLKDASLGFLAGVLFAVHPVHWEAVCNIPGRAILMSAFFVLNAFLFVLVYEQRRRGVLLVLSLAAFVCGLLSKESAGVFPGVLALYLWGRPQGTLRQKALQVFPYAVVTAVYLFWRHTLGITHVFQTDVAQTYALGFLTFLRSLITHLRILVLPVDLHFDRGLAFFNSFAQPQLGFAVLFWIAVISALLHWRRRVSALLWFLLGWCALEFLPVSQLVASIGVQPGTISAADHFLYLPSVPVFIAGVLGLRGLYAASQAQKAVSPLVFRVSAAGFLLFFFLITVGQAIYARDEVSMIKRSLSFEPHNARLQGSLGLLYVFRDDMPNAQKYFQRAVDAEPMNIRYRISLGTALCQQGRWMECLGQYVALQDPGDYRELLERQSKTIMEHLNADVGAGKDFDAKGWFILGAHFAKAGDLDRAIDAFTKSVERDRRNTAALMNLGSLYEAKKDWPNAVKAYQQLLADSSSRPYEKEFALTHMNRHP